nr:hypothetical protein OG409_24335 [Streptomyces sp. NBC_00974]
MRISGPDVLKGLVGPTTALVCVLMLASCTSADSEAEAAKLCAISPPSEEEALVRGLLGAEAFETKAYGTTRALVGKMERALPSVSKRERFYTDACGYGADDEQRDIRATFLVGWLLKTAKEPSFPGDTFYDVNGARGITNDRRSTLLVQCDLPGDLREQSRKVWLTADTSYTFGPARPKADQATEDREMTLTYLMARRITDALGCENKPLEKPPVVKPLPAP